ncbi:MAG: anhydro-N-acetylmuramic acid kinase, partial [Candidatus Korarchaeota archaeon]|nr:anhydro-N-acetylmuramic acid kinase [Candidatus Korarchaeota archaeon]
MRRNPWLEVFGAEERLVAGLISGTSMDGVDVVLAEISGSSRSLRVNHYEYYLRPYPPGLREALLRAAERGSTRMVCLLNMAVGDVFADSLASVVDEAGVRPRELDLVSSHGQTLYHAPRPSSVAGIRVRSTLQIGEISVLAERLGRPVVGDFRVRDVAAGGEGAPIIAYVDYILFSSERLGRAVQNIGGIANVTVLPPRPRVEDVYAFDTGPGNMLIDGVVSILSGGAMAFDRDGEMA